MTFEVCAREWLERQNFIKRTRKWAHQGLEGVFTVKFYKIEDQIICTALDCDISDVVEIRKS